MPAVFENLGLTPADISYIPWPFKTHPSFIIEINKTSGIPDAIAWRLFCVYQQFPTQDFTMEWTDIIKDETGKQRERRSHYLSHQKVGEPFGIPEKLIREVMTRAPMFKLVNFK